MDFELYASFALFLVGFLVLIAAYEGILWALAAAVTAIWKGVFKSRNGKV